MLDLLRNLQIAYRHRDSLDGVWSFIGTSQFQNLALFFGFCFLVAAFVVPSERVATRQSADAKVGPSRSPIEVASEGRAWRWLNQHHMFTRKPIVAPFCTDHGTAYLFKSNRDGFVTDLEDGHVISKKPGARSGALFCGADGGHLDYFDTDGRLYEQARRVAEPLIGARLVQAQRE